MDQQQREDSRDVVREAMHARAWAASTSAKASGISSRTVSATTTMKPDEIGLSMQMTKRRKLAGLIVEDEFARKNLTRDRAARQMQM